MEKVNIFLKRYWTYLIGALIGVVGGYLYWYFIGCASGTCPIKSSPTAMMAWGAVMGGLVLELIFGKDKKK